MSKLVYDNVNEQFLLEQTATQAGTVEHTLATENKFLDKNIKVKVVTPAVGTGSLAINDNTGVDVTVGTAAGGKYPLSADLTGTMSFATAGWVGTAGANASDSGVVVGQIDESSLLNGETAINSGASIVPAVDSDQTVTITDGYSHLNRTVVVKSMANGTAAEASITGTAEATAPTLVNTTSAQTGKTQINGLPIASDALTNEIDKYYMAVTPAAPATTISLTKTVDTAGYLGSNTQITAEAATTANSQLYYIPLNTGSVASAVSPVTVTPTVANDTSATVVDKTRIDAIPSTSASNIDQYYVAVKATAPATAITINNTVSAGYIGQDEVSASAATTTAADATYYVPLTTGVKSAGAGSVSASSESITLTESNSEPASGYYFTATGQGTSNIEAGWFNSNTTQTSNAATKYYSIPEATFELNGSEITVATAGYIGVGDPVGTVGAGVLSTGLVDRTSQGYTTLADNSVVIPTDDNGNGGYLYIPAGYYNATQITLGTLIPDQATTDAVSANILSGYEAFTTDGTRLIGSIATYDGTYTTA